MAGSLLVVFVQCFITGCAAQGEALQDVQTERQCSMRLPT
jgi:hypothetical protein